jgi:predicted AAA+ superfamily ATPase
MDKHIKLDTCITLSGSNGSGKTTAIKYILKSFRNLPIILFSCTAEMNGDFDEFKNRLTIINPMFHKEALKKIMVVQKKKREEGRPQNIFIIFDDVADLCKDNKVIKILISQQRHYNITIIFSVQYVTMSATFLREISSFDLIFELKTLNSLKHVHQNYFAEMSFEDFKKKMKLEKYEFIFCDKINHKRFIMKCPV